MKNSKISSLFNSEFVPQNVRLKTKFTQNSINADSERIINIHSRKPIITEMIKFDRISQINTIVHRDDSSDLSIFGINSAFSNNAIESCKDMLVPWIISDYISNRSGNSIQVIELKDFGPVQLADAPAPPANPFGALDLNLPPNPNAHGNGVAPNGLPPPGNHGNGGGGGHNIGNGGGGGGGGGYDGLNNVRIYLLVALRNPVGCIITSIIANHFNSWRSFGGAVFAIYLNHVHRLPMPNPLPEVAPLECWPGSEVCFGRVDVAGRYTDLSFRNDWLNVRAQINCVLAFAMPPMPANFVP